MGPHNAAVCFKGQGSLFDMGCKAEGFGAAQHGGGSCWERGGSRAAGSMHGGSRGAWVGRLSELMEVSEDATDETMEGGGE
eukprot:1144162-Pelagomonas_calceolata.AAC.6